jgi:hypothetical protein
MLVTCQRNHRQRLSLRGPINVKRRENDSPIYCSRLPCISGRNHQVSPVRPARTCCRLPDQTSTDIAPADLPVQPRRRSQRDRQQVHIRAAIRLPHGRASADASANIEVRKQRGRPTVSLHRALRRGGQAAQLSSAASSLRKWRSTCSGIWPLADGPTSARPARTSYPTAVPLSVHRSIVRDYLRRVILAPSCHACQVRPCTYDKR